MDIVAWLIAGLLFAVPFFRMFNRAGMNAWLALLSFVPFLGLFLCWLILAVGQWKRKGGV